MLSKILFGLIAAKAVMCSPIAEPATPDIDFTPDTLAEAEALIKFLQDIAEKRLSLNETEWQNLFTANGIHLTEPPVDQDFLNFTASVDVDVDVNVDISKRQTCGRTRQTRVTKTETFIDWDIQMSNVACARQSDIVIDITAGKWVANSLTVSQGIDPTIIKDFLKAGFKVDTGRTVTSIASNLNRATVLVGNCGAMVLNPITTRRYGTISQGCVGSAKEIGTFMADDRISANWNGVSWTGGSISDCQRKQAQPPLKRCHGNGYLV